MNPHRAAIVKLIDDIEGSPAWYTRIAVLGDLKRRLKEADAAPDPLREALMTEHRSLGPDRKPAHDAVERLL